MKTREYHGMRRSPEYEIWKTMRQRCSNPKNQKYNYYGARGIMVCKRWDQSFAAFYADMGPRPSSSHSIERIEVNGNYEPLNCQWAMPIEQTRNRRNSNIAGNVYGLLTALRLVGVNAHQKAIWLCRCKCGNEKNVTRGCLVSSYTKSCGCLHMAAKQKPNATPAGERVVRLP